MKLSLGVIIAIALIFYWWMKDHPSQAPAEPVKTGSITYVMPTAA